MKKSVKVLISIVAVAILVTLSVLSVKHYHQYQLYKNNADATTAAEAKRSHDAEVAHMTEITKEFNSLHGECVKGFNAYNQLAAPVKAKTPAPVCGAELL